MINAIPPVTRIWGGASLILSALTSLGVVEPYDLVFEPTLAFKKFQIWRVLTGLLFFGKIDMNLIIFLFTSFALVKKLEERQFPTRKSNMVFMLIITSVLVLIMSSLFGSLFASQSLVNAFSYIYGKLFSNEQIMMMMMFPLPIQYVPFVSMIVSFVSNQSILPNLIGLVCGHITLSLLFIIPVITKRPLLKAPRFLSSLIDGNQH